jgi:hypothetical protein
MTRRRRDLLRMPGVERLEHARGGHVKLILSNGRALITSGSPSDWRGARNTQARIRRITLAAEAEWVELIQQPDRDDAESAERRVAAARRAGKLAAESPLHRCRRAKS